MKTRPRRALPLFLLCLGFAGLSLEALAEDAREPYDDFYCTTCHGADGRGNVGVQAPRLAGMEPWYLRRQLEKFRDGRRGTHPQDVEGRAMRPMATRLSDDSIDTLVNWVGSWPQAAVAKTVAGDVDAGRHWYAGCSACHGADASGNQALGAPALVGQNDWYLLTQLRNFRLGYRGRHPADSEGAAMAAAAQALPDEQALVDVIAYLNTLVPPDTVAAGAANRHTQLQGN